mmetsp:Transcript_18745/g.33244  ORF Transcript_18745/g.33244 Transcript_18745/m.33244 type:complete len:333 (-) Transcript_18745:13-1011(-)
MVASHRGGKAAKKKMSKSAGSTRDSAGSASLESGGYVSPETRQSKTTRYASLGALFVFAGIVLAVSLSLALRDSEDAQADLEQAKTDALVVRLDVVETIPHADSCYTQGLFIDSDGLLVESCGLYGRSSVRKVNASTGEVLLERRIPDQYFAEGIERVGDSYHLLTWREREILELDTETLEIVGTTPLSSTKNEGWGLDSNGTVLALTDGSEYVHLLDPESLTEIERIKVVDMRRNGAAVRNLNEVEFINGYELLANIYTTDYIVRIDIRTGHVIGYISLEQLLQDFGDSSGSPEVLNGIAHDEETNEIIVTGKLWRSMFRLSLEDPNVLVL